MRAYRRTSVHHRSPGRLGPASRTKAPYGRSFHPAAGAQLLDGNEQFPSAVYGNCRRKVRPSNAIGAPPSNQFKSETRLGGITGGFHRLLCPGLHRPRLGRALVGNGERGQPDGSPRRSTGNNRRPHGAMQPTPSELVRAKLVSPLTPTGSSPPRHPRNPLRRRVAILRPLPTLGIGRRFTLCRDPVLGFGHGEMAESPAVTLDPRPG
jgi:hypothetical protein